MAASTYFAQVQQLYIAYFGRPADTIGQAYWANQIDAANGSIASVIAGFSASAESAALFGNKSSIDKVTAIYQNAFGRAPEPAGLAYWVAQLDSGKVSQAQASWTIQQSAGAGDAAAVQNKLTAAQAFTAQIDTTAEITGYQGAAAAESARAFLKTVTADNATATAAVTGAAAAVVAATAVGVVGATYTLTAGIDNLVGDSGNNTFIGDNTAGGLAGLTVSAGDQINGGAGTDTFNYFTTGGATVAPQLTAVENVNLIGGVTAVDLSGAVGLQQVTLKNTAVVATNVTVGAGVAVGLDNVKGAAGAAVASATFNGPATQTTATLNVANGSNVGVVNVDGAALTTLNVVAAAGAANTIGSLESTGRETTLNVSGAGGLTINQVGATLTTINASAATGKTVINAVGTGDLTYTGGAGDDTIAFGGSLTKADKIDGGAGFDTVSVANATAVTMAGLNAATNVEAVEFTGSAAVAVTLGSTLTNAGITKVLFNTADTAAADVVSAADAAHTYAFGTANTGAATLNLAAGVTTANVVMEGSSTLATGISNVGALTVGILPSDLAATPTLVSTVNIASSGLTGTGANVANIITSVNAEAGATINVTGSKDLTIGGAAAGLVHNATVDASAFTGKLAITGSTGADKIILGSGADTVTVNGAGSTYAAADTITNFTKADTLILTGAVVAAAADLVKFDASNSLSLAAALVSAETAIGANSAAWFSYDSNTYVVANTDAGNTVTADGSTDLVVKLAGVVTLVGDATGIHAAA